MRFLKTGLELPHITLYQPGAWIDHYCCPRKTELFPPKPEATTRSDNYISNHREVALLSLYIINQLFSMTLPGMGIVYGLYIIANLSQFFVIFSTLKLNNSITTNHSLINLTFLKTRDETTLIQSIQNILRCPNIDVRAAFKSSNNFTLGLPLRPRGQSEDVGNRLH